MNMYVDEGTINYVNHYAERLFPELYSKLTLVDNKYRELGKFASEEHQKERRALIKSNFHILEIETRMLDSIRDGRIKEIGNIDNGKLIIHQRDGRVTYWTNALRKYEAIFKPRTNPYNLLLYMAQHPIKLFSAEELDRILNPQRKGADSTEDRRARDTIQTIRDKLDLNQNPEDDFFIVGKGFGLKCDIELKS